MSNANSPITAAVVPEASRLLALPLAFGNLGLWVESMTYEWMHRLDPAYMGGAWEFYTISNTGFYMAIRGEKRQVIRAPNGNEVEVSADAAGIVATLYALNMLANRTESELIIEKYYQLRNYASAHAEREEILVAID